MRAQPAHGSCCPAVKRVVATIDTTKVSAPVSKYEYGMFIGAIALDVGDQDGLRFDMIKLHQTLDNYGIANSFEIYHGTHTSAVADRFQNHAISFFGKNLCAAKNCK